MANRIINTEIWDDLLEVSIETRLFYIYLYTNCNHAGIIKPQKAIVSVYCGKIDIFAIEKELSDCRLIVKLTNGKIFLPQFIKANYRDLVDNNSNAAKSCIVLLKENGIDYLTLNEGFMKGSSTLIEIEKEIDIDKDKEIEKDLEKEKVQKNEIVIMPPELQRLNDWLKINAPSILKMSEQMSIEQYRELFKNYHNTEILDIFQSMHNYKPLLKNNKSVYLTAKNWMERDKKTTKPTGKQSGVSKNVENLLNYAERNP